MAKYKFGKGIPTYNGIPMIGTYDPFADHFYVDNLAGSGSTKSGSGTSEAPYLTIQEACTAATVNCYIHIKGTSTNYDEAVTLTVNNVKLVGHGFGESGGAWSSDADTTILTLSGAQNAEVSGLLFRPDGATSGCAIDISEVVSNDSDAIYIHDNVFKSTGTTAKYAIKANGCPAYVKIYNNHFTWMDECISADSCAFTAATGWEIVDNYFSDKVTKGIYMPLRRCLIKGNHFSTMTTCIDTVGYSATNGDYNDVNGNYIFETATWSSVTNAQTNDSWQNNFHNFLPNVTIGGA